MPHAWKAGEQTLLLRKQLEVDGGRRPGGDLGAGQSVPLPARTLRAREPDRALPQDQEAEIEAASSSTPRTRSRSRACSWPPGRSFIPNLIEWVPLSKGGKVTSVDPKTNTLTTEFGSHKAAVANVIPPQKAGRIAEIAGVADQTGWCPIDPVTFESKLQPNIHVIGDACIAGGMPKSAFAANSQAKVCAAAVAKLLAGEKPEEPQADQHLLQSGGARLRHLGRRRVSAARTASSTDVKAPAASARRMRRAATRELRSEFRQWLVQDHHRGSLRLSGSGALACATVLAALVAGVRRARASAAGTASLYSRRRRHPGTADRRQRRSRPRARHRREPAGRALPALPHRARSRRSGSRARWRPTCKAREPAGPKGS